MKDSSKLIDGIENELLQQNIFENCTEIAKYSYDEFLSDAFLEEVPFISPFVKVGKLVLSIPDRLLMAKLIHFMDGLTDSEFKQKITKSRF